MKLRQLRTIVRCCALAAGLAMTAGVFAQSPLHDQAAWLVEHTGASYEEAQRHIAHAAEISRLRVQMTEDAADTFGGLRIEWLPKYRIVVSFTGDAKAQLRTFSSDPDFVAETTPRSLAFMEALLDRIIAKLEPWDTFSEGEVEISTSRILIMTTDVAETKRRLKSLLKAYPFIHVEHGSPPTPM